MNTKLGDNPNIHTKIDDDDRKDMNHQNYVGAFIEVNNQFWSNFVMSQTLDWKL